MLRNIRKACQAEGLRRRCMGTAAVELPSRLYTSEDKQLVELYRSWGYRHVETSPFGGSSVISPLTEYLDNATIDERVTSLKEWLDVVYCGGLGVQYTHIPDPEKQAFITHLIENRPHMDQECLIGLAKMLLRSEGLDGYFHKKYSDMKQYGGQGAEGTLAFCKLLFNLCSANKVHDVVIAIAHRGRTALMAELLDVPYERLFKKFSGDYEFHPDEKGIGDILYHLWQSLDMSQQDGGNVHITLLPNPSHLEVATSVALGKVRAKMSDLGTAPHYGDEESYPLALLIHGDAAFVGQGIAFENAQMSKLRGYSTNGTVHLITNNMIGFTSEAETRSSSFTVGDIGKMYDVPVLTVDGLDIKAINHAVTMAMAWRSRYKEDIVIDLQCYRLFGHNQHDEPKFTNPVMYDSISQLESLPRRVAQELVKENAVEKGFIERVLSQQLVELNAAYETRSSYIPPKMSFKKKWEGMQQGGSDLTSWDTGYPVSDLRFIGLRSIDLPDEFTPHKTLHRAHIKKRRNMMDTGKGLDWAMGETLAFGSLMMQGYNVRISGQDVPRGTFSQRHITMYDQNTENGYTPLNHMSASQPGKVEAICSLLSEEGVVGFEYGYSLESPNTLPIWEAQFGDFFNTAQVMYDQYVVSGEAKWILESGLVSLLPHGYDGNGPDHTSARLERWLQLSNSKEDGLDGDDINIQVVNLTTPAQYYHALRRQMLRPFRKPLFVMAPKGLLRSRAAVSNIWDFQTGTVFQRVIGDDIVQPLDVTRVLVCSGKHYYTLVGKRDELKDNTTAIIRLEEICPFPATELQAELSKYPNAELYWTQEESRNGGAWSFVSTRVRNVLGMELKYVGRQECAAVAVGVATLHDQEVEQLLRDSYSHLNGETLNP